MAKAKPPADEKSVSKAQEIILAGETSKAVVRHDPALSSRERFLVQGVPQSREEIAFIAENAWRSGMFKGIVSAHQAVMKIIKGVELRVPATVAMAKIYLIDGSFVTAAELMGAQVKRSGEYWYETRVLDYERCEINFYRKLCEATPEEIKAYMQRGGLNAALNDDAKIIVNGWWFDYTFTSTFTVEDGKRMDKIKPPDPSKGLSNWQKTLRNMLFARALSNGCRWECPHLVQGMYTFEDFEIRTDPDNGDVIWDEHATQVLVQNARTPWHLEACRALKPHISEAAVNNLRAQFTNNHLTNEQYTELIDQLAMKYQVDLPPRPVEAE